ncbi:AAA family ATPase [Mesorhizobium sp.]|uniref:ATP-dependent nuclease n=1 Tax=Mesorhizobium sp. TaxID=1871066 RepID=UPI0025F89F00|nr:AAA family ATPase [Mesorhizobium sp.]
MTDLHRFTRVEFNHFKAFEKFTLNLRNFNILVGPNNAGKSTILAAFRILASALRKATSRKAEVVSGPQGSVYGYIVDLAAISIAEENIFYNYDDSQPASIKFSLSNKNEILLFFPEAGSCHLIATNNNGKTPHSPKEFTRHFNCPIGFVPILGPVDHNEILYEKEAARLALFNYRSARNFRNIWYHYPEKFDEFREVLGLTWPGMDIEKPIVDYSHKNARLYMFCPESRIPREIFWAGFGFQVWCQMLTHLIQSSNNSLFLIDEPDIYLHSELQRQLLTLLRNIGPDILIATHSTEIITEAEADDIVVINKKRRQAQRVKNPSQLGDVFSSLGSNLNPILTQLAKTRRALFVEGKDFQILGKFASKLGFAEVGNRGNFAVIPVEGFNPERAKNIKAGMELTLGGKIASAIVFDRDYRSEDECTAIKEACGKFSELVTLHRRKEIENFLLVPVAIDRAAANKVSEVLRRGGSAKAYVPIAESVLNKFSLEKKNYVAGQFLSNRRRFERQNSPNLNDATVSEAAMNEFDKFWDNPDLRMGLIPGKDALSCVNQALQDEYKISVTPTAIIDALRNEEISVEMKELIKGISVFSNSGVSEEVGEK